MNICIDFVNFIYLPLKMIGRLGNLSYINVLSKNVGSSRQIESSNMI